MAKYLVNEKKLVVDGTNLPRGVVEAVMAPVNKASLKVQTEKDRLRFAKELTLGQRRVHAIQLLETEVGSGGYEQYFRYYGGSWYREALEGLDHIGAKKHRASLVRALGCFPGSSPSTDILKREQELDSLPSKSVARLDDVSDSFFSAYSGVEELSLRLIKLMVESRGDFFLLKGLPKSLR